ncbi:D-(-)-3-hydroxybutyrate oligomer hydrolase [Collimonas silvisoli]|uniref:D-(-)-3-hydroxybutyrate oligomer hydrolase n=1 Tax=Collimonas silvisoli TaxID=2825884 RepID=UPI001B8B0ED5|nr:D-(-)-3-hydroxybutyrate oligomer hydrolase [Collimonas silvisoli]
MKQDAFYKLHYVALAAIVCPLSACGGGSGFENINSKPAYIGAISAMTYDGSTDDLLTGGLGKTGLISATAPNPIDATAPTAAELRKIAIYTNYRAVLDATPSGGFGVLYGPNIGVSGKDTLGEGKIAGTEYIAYSDDGSGRQNVTMMVQIPDSFNPASPCIVTGTSSGSRGVYGAVGTSGEWGLKHGCAVAYNDKGTGNGIDDLQNNTVNLQNGVRSSATAAGMNSNFTANVTDAQRIAFNAVTPNRFAVKHAHSQQNPEKDWGKFTLQSIEFAYYVLNQKYGDVAKDGQSHLIKLSPANTIVIASSISNGAGAALAAAEQDTKGLISGVAVSEPNVQMAPDSSLTVIRGATIASGAGRPLYDYFTLANLLQPCAALAPSAANAPFLSSIVKATASNRCAALKTHGLVGGNTTDELATSAMNALLTLGWQPESRDLHAAMYAFATSSIAMTYSNAYGRFSVLDNLCGFSFSGTTAQLATSFAKGNGVPPTVGISIFNNNSVGGPVTDAVSISLSTGVMDYNIDGALCQRELAMGGSANAIRVQQGIREAFRSGNLQGKPAVIVHGRSDTLIPVGFSSRPYYGVNHMVEGGNSKLSYIEVTNGQHFDSFLPLAGFDSRFIPLHVYYIQAMNMMYANLKNGSALPPSQLVRTTPRGVDANGIANPISAANVPPILATPAGGDRITFANNVVTVPD